MSRSNECLLVIDQGTSGTLVSLIDSQGRFLGRQDEPVSVTYPQPGYVQQEAQDIWQSVVKGIQKVLQDSGIKPHQIAGLAITNQRETWVSWDESGNILAPVIVWSCRRSLSEIPRFKKYEAKIRQITGLPLDPYFSATKAFWLQKHLEPVRKALKRGTLRWSTIDGYLIWRLSQGRFFATDVSNAHRTLLTRLKEPLKWDPFLCDLFQVPVETLPQIRASDAILGYTGNIGVLPAGIPIISVLGDQQASLLGHGCVRPGAMKITLGTGSFALAFLGSQVRNNSTGLLTTVAWLQEGQKPQYALEGSAFGCGSVLNWLVDSLGLAPSVAALDAELAKTAVDPFSRVFFIPALSGLGAPYWSAQAKGAWLGLTFQTQRVELLASVWNALAHQNLDLIDAFKKRLKIEEVQVDGGVSQSDYLLQRHADWGQMTFVRPKLTELTTLGAWLMAAWKLGWMDPQRWQAYLKQNAHVFRPKWDPFQAKKLRGSWKATLKKFLESEIF